jgi:hypothetical protein
VKKKGEGFKLEQGGSVRGGSVPLEVQVQVQVQVHVPKIKVQVKYKYKYGGTVRSTQESRGLSGSFWVFLGNKCEWAGLK